MPATKRQLHERGCLSLVFFGLNHCQKLEKLMNPMFPNSVSVQVDSSTGMAEVEEGYSQK